MRVLIRTLFWGILVLVLIGVVAPAAIGWLLSERFDRFVAHLSVPGYLQVVSRRFDRGWFSSDARVVLRPIGPLCDHRPCPTVALDSQIDHGPLAWGADFDSFRPVLAIAHTRVDLTELWPHTVFAPQPGPLTVVSQIGLDTRAQVRLSLAGATFDVARGKPIAQVETSAVSGGLDTSVLARMVQSLTLIWPYFSLVRQAGGHIGWRGLKYKAGPGPDGRRVDREVSAQSLTLDNGKGRATRLRDLQLATRGKTDGRTTLALRIGRLVLPDNTQGKFILKARERGLKPAAWARLPARWAALGGWSGGALNEPALYHRVLPDLLAGGVELGITRLALVTADGTIRITAELKVPKALRPAATAVGLLSQLNLRVRLSFPRAILRRILTHTDTLPEPDKPESDQPMNVRIAGLIKRRLIAPSDDGKGYVTRLMLHAGRITINGRARPEWRALVLEFQAAAQGI